MRQEGNKGVCHILSCLHLFGLNWIDFRLKLICPLSSARLLEIMALFCGHDYGGSPPIENNSPCPPQLPCSPVKHEWFQCWCSKRNSPAVCVWAWTIPSMYTTDYENDGDTERAVLWKIEEFTHGQHGWWPRKIWIAWSAGMFRPKIV